jgi:endonuclease/exonuclease/phosphatase family metal-dependent hydrolase
MPPASPSSRHRTRTLRPQLISGLTTGLAAALVALVTGSSLALLPSPAGAAEPSGEEAARSAVTAIQANIKSDLSVERFQADVREVLGMAPDVVTYNEVPLRVDTVLAPEGYDIYRKKRNRYTAATAVVWRSDRWSLVDSGTFRVSNYREVPPGRNIKIGLRYANWVTLVNAEGRKLSVVAAHVAPLDKDMPDLLRPSVRRIGKLVTELAPAGPVLVGGDFNVHYKSGRYPRDLLGEAKMVPTYDTLESYFPTGDHQGATIDYVFNRGADLLGATQHRAVEMNSDHDAVVTGFDWMADGPSETQRLVSNPDGDVTAKRRAVKTLATTIAATDPGQSLDVVSSGMVLRVVFRRLSAAINRGVDVRYVTRSAELTPRERALARTAATAGGGSSVTQCREDCLAAWRDSGMSRTFMMVRNTSGTATSRLDANRILSSAMVQERTRLVTRTGEIGLQEGETQLARLR